MKKPDSGTVPNDWIVPFMGLREQLRPLVDADLKLHHGIILSGLDSSADVSEISKELEPAYEADLAMTAPPFRVGKNVWVRHFFFAHDRALVTRLEELLVPLDDWLMKVPDQAFGGWRSRLVTSHAKSNLLRWLSLLYYLAWKYKEESLWVNLGYSDSIRTRDYDVWNWSPYRSLCDPWPFVTLARPDHKKLPLWQPGGDFGGQKAPELIEAWLEGDVLELSMNAVVLLKYYGIDPPVPQGPSVSPQSQRPRLKMPRLQRLGKKLKELAKTLLEALVIYHHHTRGGEIIKKPRTQRELCEMLRWQYPRDQGKLSRVMREIFVPPPKPDEKKKRSNGMAVYRRKCKRGELEEFWEKKEQAELQERLGIKGNPVDLRAELIRKLAGFDE